MSKRTVAEMSADWLREASVLVAVFGWLDKRVQGQAFAGPWAIEAGGAAALLFLVGSVVERIRQRE